MTPFKHCKDCWFEEIEYGKSEECIKCHEFALSMALDLFGEEISISEKEKLQKYFKEHTDIDFKKELKHASNR